MGRYLTTAEKRSVLGSWRRTLSQPRPAEDQPGRGYPDTDMIPWCDRLNALRGVCTVQSCAGHRYADGTRTSGGIWLRLDCARAEAFCLGAFELAKRTPHIERVSMRYASWGQEIVIIDFAGNEHGLLAESLEIVTGFISRL